MLRKGVQFSLFFAVAFAQILPKQEGSSFSNGKSQNYGQEAPNNYGQSWNSTVSTKVSVTNSKSNVRITLQLISYNKNGDNFRLPPSDGIEKACACTSNLPCTQLDTPPACKLGFMIVMATPNDSVRYETTQYLPLDNNGNLNTNEFGFKKSFNVPRVIDLATKPTAIDIFVHNLGAIVNPTTNNLIKSHEIYHVDTFALPLNVSTSVGVQHLSSLSSETAYGSIFNSVLRYSLSISCTGDLLGENCDLSCNSTTQGSSVCRDRQGYYSVCEKQGNQVSGCTQCPFGYVKDQNEHYFCKKEDGSLVQSASSGLVAGDFKTWTIILGIACALLLFVLICVIIAACVASRRRPPVQPDPGYNNYRSAMRSHEGQAERPLLQTANDGNGSVSGRPPIAPMRMNPPSLGAQPQKSALRKNFAPPAHYGGGDSVNETLNSSFASSVPVPPSRSADV
ncbi:hypothetical protein L596_004430 [Steinernema carpocapsae]|uniref:Uncharacterized protein n=1 Tax=Steinernema carpocapsae TaxID=34508 RepID=A0A4U8UVW3_STECR|nr:hypothetical protein L596_004430 [Steinernema carpocapsae]